jgi:hypothetical protein
MIGMRRLGLALCAGLFSLSVGAAGEKPGDYAVQVPLTLSGEGPWYRLELPMALHFAARHADLRDLRVFNAEGEPLAYALTLGSARYSETRTETAVNWFPLYSEANAGDGAPRVWVQRSTSGTVVEVVPEDQQVAGELLRGWLLDASAIEAPLHKLVLDWSADREGFQRFTIEASDDLQHWRSWGSGQIARLSFADERIDQREIALPGEEARYLRLLWQSPRQAPALMAARLQSATSDSIPAPMAWSAPLPPKSAKDGEYSWELPLALPLERLRIELPQANTLAPVVVSGRRDGKVQWQTLTRGLLYRLPQNGEEVRQEEIELYGGRVQHLRLRVDERGGGLGTPTPLLQVGLRATQVVFLARGTPPYVLALGKPSGEPAQLPLTTLIPGYDSERLAKLGVAHAPDEPEQQRVSEVAIEQAQAFDWRKAGLWAVLLLGVGLLALMAFSLLRTPPAKD